MPLQFPFSQGPYHQEDPDEDPRKHKRVREPSSHQIARRLWDHWCKVMHLEFPNVKIQPVAGGKNMRILKSIVDQCGKDEIIARRMIDILVLDWGAFKTKVWQVKKDYEAPELFMLNLRFSWLYDHAFQNKGIIDAMNRVSRIGRDERKRREKEDPDGELKRQIKEWEDA